MDSDLAMLYQVETKIFNQAVRRNIERFPENFRSQLTNEEFDALRSQIVTSNGGGGRRYRPYMFTEQGIAMLSGKKCFGISFIDDPGIVTEHLNRLNTV